MHGSVMPGSFGTSCLKFFLRPASHDEQAAVRQLLRKNHGSVFTLEPEEAFSAQTDRSNDWPHLRLRVGVKPNAVIPISIQVAEGRIVASIGEPQIRIRFRWSCLLDASFEFQQFRDPGQRLVLASRVRVMSSRIAVIRLVARDWIPKCSFVPPPRALARQGFKELGSFIRRETVRIINRFQRRELGADSLNSR
jgi:hypothetical protein